MEAFPVNSTCLDVVSYDEDTEILILEFDDGSLYRYLDVPLGQVVALLAAPSKGIYFNQSIRPAAYVFTRL
jgi:hypothetical protein